MKKCIELVISNNLWRDAGQQNIKFCVETMCKIMYPVLCVPFPNEILKINFQGKDRE